jgi:hypothetical protein
VRVSHPALDAVIAARAARRSVGVRGSSVCLHATIMVANEVKTRRKTMGGFVTST